MKKIIMGLLLFAMANISVSAQTKGLGQSDPDAKKILDAVSAKFKSYKSVKAKFLLKIESAAGKSLGSKSGILFMKNSKYRITVPGQEIYSDGVNISTYEKASNEITITKFDPTANTLTPQKLFTNFYDKDFLYKLHGDKVVNGKKLQEIELTPTDKSKPFFKVLLYVDKVANAISSAKIFEKAGNKYTYAVSNIITSVILHDVQFVLDIKKYPGAEVVDLR